MVRFIWEKMCCKDWFLLFLWIKVFEIIILEIHHLLM